MRARRMSSGITVGVRWELADDVDPTSSAGCVRLLERDAARLGPDELTRMRRALRRQHQGRPRRASRTEPYRELLGEVLDYRRWRSFAFILHPAGGGEERLTRARHSQLSGGEQSVSLHLPLFAAAHAMFDSARPARPRLLGLDEAFAGVDDNGRSELLALAAAVRPRPVHDRLRPVGDLRRPCPAPRTTTCRTPPPSTPSARCCMVWDGRRTDADARRRAGARARLAAAPPGPRRGGRRPGVRAGLSDLTQEGRVGVGWRGRGGCGGRSGGGR